MKAGSSSTRERQLVLLRLALVLSLLALWEIAGRWLVDPMFFSPPSRVVGALGEVVRMDGVQRALVYVLLELTVAFMLSVAGGVALGLAVGLGRFPRRALLPIVVLLYGIPQVTVLPLFILYFGIGPASKIAFGVSHGIFPIALAVSTGIQGVKPVLLNSAKSMGASSAQMFRYVMLPSMIGSFFAGIRLCVTAVLLGVLLAELYVSLGGIGYYTTLFTLNLDSAKLLALISMLSIMALLINELSRSVERYFGRWQRQ